MTNTNLNLVEAVKSHAIANYDVDGWDFVVEAANDEELAIVIGGAKTAKTAIAKVRKSCKLLNEQRAEVRAEIDGEEEDQPKRGSVIPAEIKKRYGREQNCGDDVVQALIKAVDDGHELEAIATQNGVDFGRWSHLNPGMQRMNFGNVLRGMVNREEEVTIGDWAFTVPVVA